MICTKCVRELGDCTCPDADERLRQLAHDPAAHVAFKWCRLCDRHYARCRCTAPDFYVILNGEEMAVPTDGFENMAGGRTKPDLTRR